MPQYAPMDDARAKGMTDDLDKSVQEQVRAWMSTTEEAVGVSIPLKLAPMPWLICDAAGLLAECRRTTGDGMSPHLRIFGKDYQGVVCRFSEVATSVLRLVLHHFSDVRALLHM